jgi:Asp-tRNA(Asn)/Glu-tRNA(Gln) amidotransferase A subunit family amidase
VQNVPKDLACTNYGFRPARCYSSAHGRPRRHGWYLDRIRRLDRQWSPELNAVISVNEQIMDQAAELDARFASEGFVGPLHGVPILVKDQIDVAEMPTTCGSVLFRDNWPKRDAFVTTRLRAAGALMLGKTTLGRDGRR